MLDTQLFSLILETRIRITNISCLPRGLRGERPYAEDAPSPLEGADRFCHDILQVAEPYGYTTVGQGCYQYSGIFLGIHLNVETIYADRFLLRSVAYRSVLRTMYFSMLPPSQTVSQIPKKHRAIPRTSLWKTAYYSCASYNIRNEGDFSFKSFQLIEIPVSSSLFPLYCKRKYDDAMALYKESLNIRQKNLGLSHPDVARSLKNMTELLRR